MRHDIHNISKASPILLAVLIPFLLPKVARGQSTDHNYISEKTYTAPGELSYNQTINYYDGLGRQQERVDKGAWISGGAGSGDIVQFRTYDSSGRPYREYLPVGYNGNGNYVGKDTVSTKANTLYADAAPFAEVHYNGSPLDRVRSEWGAGSAWRTAGKAREYVYGVNLPNVPKYKLEEYGTVFSGNTEAVVEKYGEPFIGSYRVTESTDEDGRCLLTFTDAFGQTVLERRLLSESDFADTYYCHDRAGRLVGVLPPVLTNLLSTASGFVYTLSSTAELGQYAYFYRYDAKGQLIAKKLPGAEWIYYVYDKGGRLIYSQDGNQRLRGEWSFALSDRQGRPCLTGTKEMVLSPFTDPLGDVQVFVQRNDPSTDMRDYGYLPVNFDLSDADILTVCWYDDYAFLGNMDGIPSAASQTSPTRFDVMAVTDCGDEQYEYGGVGRMTGRLEKVLGETDENQYLWSVLYYDDRGRVVQESHATHRGGWQRTNTGYDFTGHPLSARIIHHDPTVGDMTERYTYSYDDWGRPLTVTHRLDTLPAVVLHAYAYDAAGRLAGDGRNGDADLRTNYTYNVRSWLTDIKVGGSAQQGTEGETFTEKLYYQTLRPVNPQPGVQWGGNVSAMDWMAGSDGVGRRYDFAYDGLSRLTGAGYADDGAGQSDYSRGYGYDRNGNVTLLATATDTTQVTYAGNHLSSGNSYAYDANGNLTKDLIRSISSISYNILNLPQQVEQQVSLRGGIVPFDEEPTFYLYTASGVKLQSITGLALVLPGHPDTRDRTDYVGNLIYDRTSLKKILIDGGYVEVSGNTKNYRFFVKDHLGNNRLVADASGAILQTNHYDPYGASLPAGAAADSGNPYKWGGKEHDDKAVAYDFGARHYTSSIPRWTTMDPLCEKYYSISPYAYCAGNPINLVDPNGMIFTENSKSYIDQYEQAIDEEYSKANRSIERLKRRRNQTKNDKAIKRLSKRLEKNEKIITELDNAKKELQELKESTQVYNVKVVDKEHKEKGQSVHGESKYNNSTGAIDVILYSTLESSEFNAGLAHEFVHLYQFEKGEIGFDYSSGKGSRYLYDYNDETAAFFRGSLFSTSHHMDSSYNKLSKQPFSISSSLTDSDKSYYSKQKNLVFRSNNKTYVPH